jgi:hypothetical protein
MKLEFTNGVAELRLSEPREAEVLQAAAVRYADRLADAALASRTYHMGTSPNPDRDYDDRLTTRLGCCATTCYTYLGLPVQRGGLRHSRLGKKYHITEQDVRDFEAHHSGRKEAA